MAGDKKKMLLARILALAKPLLLLSTCHNAGPMLAKVNRSTSKSLL
jgi:hypothetical protein